MEEASDSLGWVDYAWLADGTKVSVEDQNGNGYLYADSLVYSKRDGTPWKIESASFDAGRIIATENSAEGNEPRSCMPLYQLKDHLGSVRTVFTLADGAARVIAQNDYYPLGMRHYSADMALGSDALNRYLFGGKEEQVTGSLGLLDFGARMYDLLTGRWAGVDPLSEKYFGFSPYVYCAGNPVIFVDPDGMGGPFRQEKRKGFCTVLRMMISIRSATSNTIKNRTYELKTNKKGEARTEIDRITDQLKLLILP